MAYIYTKTSIEWQKLYIDALDDLIAFQKEIGDIKSVKNDGDEITYQNVLEALRAKQNLVNNLKKQYELALQHEQGEQTEKIEDKIGILYFGRDGY